jgi:hypothetical protein
MVKAATESPTKTGGWAYRPSDEHAVRITAALALRLLPRLGLILTVPAAGALFWAWSAEGISTMVLCLGLAGLGIVFLLLRDALVK